MKNRKPIHDEWETPDDLFRELDQEFGFIYDPAASDQNWKCKIHSTINDDGISTDWLKIVDEKTFDNRRAVFINPPYNRLVKEAFIKKSYQESLKGLTCVMLLPVSTSTKIFHEIIYHHAKIRFLKGRVKFIGINTKGQKVDNKCGQHDSMIVIFQGRKDKEAKG